MRRSYLWGVLVLIVTVAALLIAVKADAPSPQEPLNLQTATSTESTSTPTVKTIGVAAPHASSTPAAQTPATATLIALGTRFPLHAPEGATVKEAMDQLKQEGNFTYAYKEYAGLGSFVTEIQGRAGTNEYWILYVNGKNSDAGISATHIHSGDIIEWKLEKSY